MVFGLKIGLFRDNLLDMATISVFILRIALTALGFRGQKKYWIVFEVRSAVNPIMTKKPFKFKYFL